MTDAQYMQFLTQMSVAARTQFKAFVMLVNAAGVLPSELVVSKCHRFLIQMVQDIVDGHRHNRNAVSMPPQHGKSTFLSVLATAWVMGHRPGIQIAITGFSHELVTDFSQQIKAIVNSAAYRLVFPDVQVDPTLDRLDYWRATNGSVIRAKSVGKKLTGRRVDWLIIDDAHAGRREAESALARRTVREWYFGDCVSRLAPGASVFLIGTRFHEEDLIGYLGSEEYTNSLIDNGLGQELYEFVNLPAQCTDNDDALGREFGEALFPEVRDGEFLDALRLGGIPNYEWESQYQGHPVSSGSGQIDTDLIRMVELDDLPETGLEFVRGWDLALTEKRSSDFTAGCLLAYHKRLDRIYIVDMFHDKKTWPKLKPIIRMKALNDLQRFGLLRIGMEGVSGFDIGFREMKDDKALKGKIKVEKKNPKGDKLLRAQPWINMIEAGKVYMVQGRWNKELKDEMRLFPDGTHDDQVDAISVAYELVLGKVKFAFA